MTNPVVQFGLCRRALVQLSYAVGAVMPLSLFMKAYGTVQGKIYMWLHFFINAAALAMLVRGASSVMSGERIAGFTWSHVVGFGCFPWFDRVESSSNPTDGLSRGKLVGPWVLDRSIQLPRELWDEHA